MIPLVTIQKPGNSYTIPCGGGGRQKALVPDSTGKTCKIEARHEVEIPWKKVCQGSAKTERGEQESDLKAWKVQRVRKGRYYISKSGKGGLYEGRNKSVKRKRRRRLL